ncbi:hypothetical protein DOA20_26910 [Salmonella enterica subsp. enterica serovar Newport]|nr:hypothetical protein [Salmonella enterica subsp. enterica serovar Newport]
MLFYVKELPADGVHSFTSNSDTQPDDRRKKAPVHIRGELEQRRNQERDRQRVLKNAVRSLSMREDNIQNI